MVPVRLEESEAIINSHAPDYDPTAPRHYGFHTGTRPDLGTYTENGLFHCNFVKTLTNLTDLGPDDGGTVVIAGSHKIKAPQQQIIACAYEDPSLIHQVIAPAGSTLLFAESLIHATGQLRSDKERVIIIGGYTPPMFRAWPGQEPSQAFIDNLPEVYKPLIGATASWHWEQRYRTLDMPMTGD
ncbi:MAG: phytanoyl-CoA dioxygenase family protein [Caldilineaceae bacterium]